jgi:hypothetical protein
VFAAGFIPLLDLLPARRHILVAGAFAAHLVLAAGYWLTADSARGRVAMARWRELEPIAQSIAQKPECIAAADVSGDDVFMLELMLDHRIPFADHGPIPSTTEWLLAKRNAGPAAANFVRCTEAKSLCLMRRGKPMSDRLVGVPRAVSPSAQ